MKNIFIGSDHGGVDLKSDLVKFLKKLNYNVQDLGTSNRDSVDYTDYAEKVAKLTANQESNFGILICRTGIGMSISANKIKNIRAALVNNTKIAKLSRLHNNANIICFGADFISYNDARESVKIFITTEFEGGRHEKRVNKIQKLEE